MKVSRKRRRVLFHFNIRRNPRSLTVAVCFFIFYVHRLQKTTNNSVVILIINSLFFYLMHVHDVTKKSRILSIVDQLISLSDDNIHPVVKQVVHTINVNNSRHSLA